MHRASPYEYRKSVDDGEGNAFSTMSGNLLPAISQRSLADGATLRLSGDDGPLPGRRDIHIRLQNRALIKLKFNPYWNRQGVTFSDDDGYRVVIQHAAWHVES